MRASGTTRSLPASGPAAGAALPAVPIPDAGPPGWANASRPAFQVPNTRPSSARPSNGVFCALPGNAPATTFHARSGWNRHRSAGAPRASVPASTPSTFAGRAVSSATACASDSEPPCTCARLTASSVASPAPPGEACANGSRLSSASRGWWSEAMASIVPSSSPAATASRSLSGRSGGDSLAYERKSPIAVSLRSK